jgi:uncharacterized protein (TIGR02266 family)
MSVLEVFMAQKKVLLVDDVELFLDLEKTFFRREEVTLLFARTGRQAVDLTLAERPDVVFMDLFMPDMNGDEACRLIKQHPECGSTPVVMVTHGGRDADLETCRAAGCDDILYKPISRHQLLDTAHRFLQLTERAADPRIPAKLTVRYGQGMQRQLTDYSVNISTGGLFLETASPLPAGSELLLEFPLPGRAESVVCQARVAWVNAPDCPGRLQLPSGMGMQFLDLSLDDLQSIREYIKQECLASPL